MKKLETIFTLPFILNDTKNHVYRRISVDYDEHSGHHDHIWAVLQCVEVIDQKRVRVFHQGFQTLRKR